MCKKIISLILVVSMVFGFNAFVSAETINIDLPLYKDISTEHITVTSEKISLVGWRYLGYDVDIQQEGYYWFGANLTQCPEGARLGVSQDEGKNYIETDVNGTGYHDISRIYLKKGINSIYFRYMNDIDPWYGAEINRLVLEKDSDKKNEVSIPKQDVTRYKKYTIPTNIEAEDFDNVGNCSRDGVNTGKYYRPNDQMDIYQEGDKLYLEMMNGEYVQYTFDVNENGYYSVAINHSGMGKIHTYFDDAEYPIETSLGEYRDAIKFEDAYVATIYLTEGEHKIKLVAQNAITRIDYLKIRKAKEDETVTDIHNKNGNKIGFNKIIINDAEASGQENPVFKNIYVSVDGNDNGSGEQSSPYATIARAVAQAKLISKDMTGDIVINISKGIYFQKSTLDLSTLKGNNGYNIIFRGEGEEKPIISGGQKVTGWQKTKGGIYKAKYKHNANNLTAMYVNSYPAILAQTRYLYRIMDFHYDSESGEKDGIVFSARNFPEISSVDELWVNKIYEWAHLRVKVKEVKYNNDDNTVAVILDNKDSSVNALLSEGSYIKLAQYTTVWFVNQKEFVDEPGEYWYDKEKSELYYYPYDEEDMDTAEIYVPRTEMLVNINGKDSGNIVFDNISFRYGAWDTERETSNSTFQAGYRNVDNGKGYSISLRDLGQVNIEDTENITIENCEFAALGSAAINCMNGASNIKINGNVFRDIGGSSIEAGEIDDSYVSRNIEFTNNYVRRTGYIYKRTAGTDFYLVQGSRIANNDIRETPYTGITFSWGWGSGGRDNSNNEIAYNRIDKVMSDTRDGGGIYTVGSMKGSYIHDNYISRSQHVGIYNDSGSSFDDIYNNVIEDVRISISIDTGKNIGQHIFNNYSNSNQDNFENASGTFIDNNWFCREWPTEAKMIMNRAGVKEKYRENEKLTYYPEWRTNFSDYSPHNVFSGMNDFAISTEYTKGFLLSTSTPYSHMAGIGYTNQYDWWEWDVEIYEDGEYTLTTEQQQANKGDAVQRVTVDGEVRDVIVPPAENWLIHTTVDCGKYQLKKGKHTLRIEIISENNFGLFGFTFDNGKKQIGNDPRYDEGVIGPRHEKPDYFERNSEWLKKDSKRVTPWETYTPNSSMLATIYGNELDVVPYKENVVGESGKDGLKKQWWSKNNGKAIYTLVVPESGVYNIYINASVDKNDDNYTGRYTITLNNNSISADITRNAIEEAQDILMGSMELEKGKNELSISFSNSSANLSETPYGRLQCIAIDNAL